MNATRCTRIGEAPAHECCVGLGVKIIAIRYMGVAYWLFLCEEHYLEVLQKKTSGVGASS